jgi:manganese transport protein
LLTGLDTVIVLSLKGQGFRQLEAIVLGLIGTIALCFAAQMVISPPDPVGVLHGALPDLSILRQPHALYLAVGVLGATVMPHNLYLHSSVVQTRLTAPDETSTRTALRFATIDTVVALVLATFVNAAILCVSASTFHAHGFAQVAEIEDAYRLLAPITGAAAATLLFGIALFASGQSATFTGTVAGQVILEGFLDLKIPCWQRRIITRGLALIPALGGVLWLGDHAVGRLLVLSQVVLSLQLPFAIYPLIRFTGNRAIMGVHANGPMARIVAWSLFALIVAANVWLVAGWAAFVQRCDHILHRRPLRHQMHLFRLAGPHHTDRTLGANIHAGHGQHLWRPLPLELALQHLVEPGSALLAKAAVQLLAAFPAYQQNVAPFGGNAARLPVRMGHLVALSIGSGSGL